MSIAAALKKLGISPHELSRVWLAVSKGDVNQSYTLLGVHEHASRACPPEYEPWVYQVIHNMIQGPLGADRCDFTLRVTAIG